MTSLMFLQGIAAGFEIETGSGYQVEVPALIGVQGVYIRIYH
jgi:hypothetical protein